MEAVEINAGAWYLRALRADDRISDVPALDDLGLDDPAGYVASATAGWSAETAFTWAVCEPTTGELVALIGFRDDGTPVPLQGRARSGHQSALAAATGPVARFGAAAIGLEITDALTDAIPMP
ncbi:GNAT family N-acetyltransferase [Gordonia insulae]|uniref:GNAT family N-acetyltransferase n=1 Tax=Gordonia insulae TaxID=2420509 RepID=A0A3G8JID3_9ACTN|nr:hypothetical protein [Gordonia insulae]AZG44847.1 hypothetical protein D7316_01438 [Gordonia insulae]